MPDPATDQSRIDASLFIGGALVTQDYLLEGITQTPEWGRVDVTAMRGTLEGIFARFPHGSQPNEPTTESDLIWPVLEALGWTDWLTQQNLSSTGRVDVPDGLLFIDAAAKARANEHPEEWKRYSHGAAVIESKRWGRALDRAEGRKGADKDTPSTQLLRYLRRIDDLTSGELRWGILTNGAKWRLYFAGARSTIDDYLEIDLARIMRLDDDLLDSGITDAERDHWLRVFAIMFSRAAFERASARAASLHDRARRDAAFYEQRVAKSLSDLVFQRLYPMLGKAVAKAAPADAPLDDVRQATLILLYRLLFILYAEDRGLLPVKDTRFDDYALRMARLDIGRRRDAGDTFSSVAKTIWNRFADLSLMIDKGDASVGLPPYNGGLFSTEQTPLLANIALPDDVMAEALDILSFEELDGRRRYINYRDLSVQQLGSIYERLLEFELTRDETGAVDVRPNIFARKNSGSYYTPDDLVLLIIDETLEPLIDDAMQAFKATLSALRPKDSEDYRITQLQKADPAKAITRLRICDPAMGSGHFLVSLVDRLTNHTLTAIAEAAALASAPGIDLDYESPVSEEIRKVRGTIRHNAEDAGWTVSEEQLDDPQLVKRMVLKRCVYGADKNPMAVELAKVALWLHTFTVGAPLSFIDHHLAAGDSLFGLWVRDAIDKAAKGGELLYFEALSNAQRQAVVMRTIESLTDAEIAEAHRSAEMWKDVEAQTGALDSFVSFLHALDWLNLPKADKPLVTLWLDARFGDPIAIARGRLAPDVGKAKPEEVERFTAIWMAARALIEEERFLNWQITFPGVWDNWASAAREGGFDAVVGNPPWDRIKLQQVEWFAARRPEIAKAQKASDRTKMIKALEKAGDPLFADYAKADRRAADTMRIARKSGHFPLLSRGDINLYSLFVERAYALVKPNGMVGLLTPSGIASDLSASEFFRKIATGSHLKALYDFENRRSRYYTEPFFPDVDSRFKFCAMIGSPQRNFEAAHCGFFLQAIEEIDNADQAFPIAASDFARVNPNTGTAPIFRSARDAELIVRIYRDVPVLADHNVPLDERPWLVRYCTMFHMTNDSHLFRTAEEMEREGWYPAESMEWRKGGCKAVPLYAGRMFHQFDHRAAGVDVNDENVHNVASSDQASLANKADPDFIPIPQFWVPWENVQPKRSWALAFRDIARPTDVRTIIAAILPGAAYGNKAPLLLTDDATTATLLLGNLNSFVLDYVARSKIQSANANWYIVEQLPILPESAYDQMFGPESARDIVSREVQTLSYTANNLSDYAREVGLLDHSGNLMEPFTWDENDRRQRRARLDAIFFILYGISKDDAEYILSTFSIIRKQDENQYGYFLTRDLILAQMNALQSGDVNAVVHPRGLSSRHKSADGTKF